MRSVFYFDLLANTSAVINSPFSGHQVQTSPFVQHFDSWLTLFAGRYAGALTSLQGVDSSKEQLWTFKHTATQPVKTHEQPDLHLLQVLHNNHIGRDLNNFSRKMWRENNNKKVALKISKPTQGKEKEGKKWKEANFGREGKKSLIVRGSEMERGDVEG